MSCKACELEAQPIGLVMLLQAGCRVCTALLCRLDKSVNTLTIKRALLGLAALWHRISSQDTTWVHGRRFFTDLSREQLRRNVETFYSEVADDNSPRQHDGIFEGSALSGVIVAADKSFDWSSLPATAGMPSVAHGDTMQAVTLIIKAACHEKCAHPMEEF